MTRVRLLAALVVWLGSCGGSGAAGGGDLRGACDSDLLDGGADDGDADAWDGSSGTDAWDGSGGTDAWDGSSGTDAWDGSGGTDAWDGSADSDGPDADAGSDGGGCEAPCDALGGDAASEVSEPLACQGYVDCMAGNPDSPQSCTDLLSDKDCQACRVAAAVACAQGPCGASAGDVDCILGCKKHPDLSVCVLNCGSKSVADCLSSYVSGGACNEEIAGCGLPPVDDLCASCAATYRECTADATGLTCGSCLDGYQEVGGVCVEVEDCGGGCGPGGACDEVTGLCDCLPGHAYVGGAPCQPVLWLNEWAEVVAEDEVATFKQGSDNFGAQYGPCHQVSIAYQYYMLKYEVTRAEYRLCVEEGPCSAPVCGDMPGFPEVDLESVHYANHPVICVDKAAAAAYCNWIGGRLPSESEWEYAAGAPLLACPAGWWYPWQSSTISGAYANYSNQPNPFQSLDLPYDMNGGPTTPVGFFDGSLRTREQSGWVGGPDTFQTQSNASPFGVFDLPGNVAEWALDSWHDDYSVGAPVDGSAWLDQGSPMGVKRGEGWPDDGKALSTFFRGPKAKAETLTYMGIRCVYSK